MIINELYIPNIIGKELTEEYEEKSVALLGLSVKTVIENMINDCALIDITSPETLIEYFTMYDSDIDFDDYQGYRQAYNNAIHEDIMNFAEITRQEYNLLFNIANNIVINHFKNVIININEDKLYTTCVKILFPKEESKSFTFYNKYTVTYSFYEYNSIF